ncbi:hypothetical protein [Rhodopila sp.]|uniref:hypothetical protein n=1 Tax=Rhodopila sp. TaxID=2480087 RepID=UPI003D0CC3A1
MTVEPFPITFSPAQLAVDLLAKIANDPTSPYQALALNALEAWRNSLATPEQIALVATSDELEIDDAGACVSEGNDGFFIQTWTWVECDMSEEPTCSECGEAMFITEEGIAHHRGDGSPNTIDHDADADHVAISEGKPT